jgi:cytoskeletal protein RodZ
MGGCISTVDQKADKARSDEIDKQIEEDNKRFKRECKILLLGTSLPLAVSLALTVVLVLVVLPFPALSLQRHLQPLVHDQKAQENQANQPSSSK